MTKEMEYTKCIAVLRKLFRMGMISEAEYTTARNRLMECLSQLEKQAQQKQIYKDYYNGEHTILRNYDMQDSRRNQKKYLIFHGSLSIMKLDIYSVSQLIMYPSRMTMISFSVLILIHLIGIYLLIYGLIRLQYEKGYKYYRRFK